MDDVSYEENDSETPYISSRVFRLLNIYYYYLILLFILLLIQHIFLFFYIIFFINIFPCNIVNFVFMARGGGGGVIFLQHSYFYLFEKD